MGLSVIRLISYSRVLLMDSGVDLLRVHVFGSLAQKIENSLAGACPAAEVFPISMPHHSRSCHFDLL